MTVRFQERVNAGSCFNNYVLVRTWTATDACGNSTETTQIVTVEDNKAPELAGVPADASASCGEALPPIESVAVTATDNCDQQVEVTFEETREADAGACAGGEVIVRTWTATDACGNTTEGVQRISLTDDAAPVITGVPNDETVSCDNICLLYTSPSPRDQRGSRMPSSA